MQSIPTITDPLLVQAIQTKGWLALVVDGQQMADANAAAYVTSWAGSADQLAANQVQLQSALSTVFAAKLAAGFTWTDGHVFPLGPDKLGSTGIANLQAIDELATAAVNGDNTTWPNGAFITDINGANVSYDPPTAVAVCKGAGKFVRNLRAYYRSLSAQITAATNMATLQATNINAGWPTS